MAKPPEAFETYLIAEDAIDVLEAVLMYQPKYFKNKVTVSLLKYLREKISQGKIKAFKKDEWTSFLDFLDAHQNTVKTYSEEDSWPVFYDHFIQWIKDTPDES
jgi:Cullin binding